MNGSADNYAPLGQTDGTADNRTHSGHMQVAKWI